MSKNHPAFRSYFSLALERAKIRKMIGRVREALNAAPFRGDYWQMVKDRLAAIEKILDEAKANPAPAIPRNPVGIKYELDSDTAEKPTAIVQ